MHSRVAMRPVKWSGLVMPMPSEIFVKFLNNHEIQTKITNRFKTVKSIDNVTVGFVHDVHEQHNAKASGIVKHQIIEIIVTIAIIALE